jgi:glutamate:GABA antiporter
VPAPAADRIEDVERRSAGFHRELGLRDLILIQIMYVVGSGWVGTAAKLGTAHLVFWVLAAAAFYLPQAAVVIFLSRIMPLEGGLYQWATVAFGKFVGFLVGWNMWAFAILTLATFGVMIATNLAYLIGPAGGAFTHTVMYTALVSVVTITGITTMSVFGLKASKWIQNIGGAAQFLTFGALILIPFVALQRKVIPEYHPFAASMPTLTLFSLNIFGKMALGAFSGFEWVAILAGECKSPARTIGQSVLAASPIIAVMFILGTSGVLALVPQNQIDLVSPIPQALTAGFQGMGVARLILPALIVTLLVRQIGNATLLFAGNTRLPMVAGWDGLLPAWFTKLHPRFRTPVNSILFVGAITAAFALAGLSGVGLQEGFQLLENTGGIFYAFAYLALFAVPLIAASRLTERPPLWLRAASASGLAVTVLYCMLSVFPIVEVASWMVFSVKIIGVLVSVNLIGVAIYAAGQRPRVS